MAFVYFDTTHAIEVHDEIINQSGGVLGILNINLLESVIEHVQNDLYYPDLEHKLTHLFYSINKNIAFKTETKEHQLHYQHTSLR